MKLAFLVAAALPLAACSNEPEVDVENASVGEVAREVADASGSASFIRAGKWESRVNLESIDAPGMPDSVKQAMQNAMGKDTVHTSCLTPEQVKKPKEDFFAGADKSCRYDHFRMGDGAIDAKMRCSAEGMSQEMAMAGTYSPDSYSMRMTTKASGGGGPSANMSMTMKVDAKRIGECDGSEA
jgi:hypothetical protein